MARDWVALGSAVLEEGVKALVPGLAPLVGVASKALASEKASFARWREDKANQEAFADAVRTWGQGRGFDEASIEDGMTAAADILRQSGASMDDIARLNLDHAAVAKHVLEADPHPLRPLEAPAQEVCRHAIDEFYLRFLRDLRPDVRLDRAVQREQLKRSEDLRERVADAISARAALRTDLRVRLADIRRDYGLLGGRGRELARLDEFLASPDPSYLLLTGDAGMGKTALLAGWIQKLEQRAGTEVVHHFISRQYGTAAQQDVMASLVAQTAAAWRSPLAQGVLGATVPELEAEWLRLLQDAPPRPVAIVIDGLDEAEAAAWQVPRLLFPEPLPPGVHVVLSARSIAHRDWAAFLGIDRAATLTVGKLDADGVADVLDVAKAPDWVRDQDSLGVLRERTDGDPFYLRLLVEALRTGEISSAAELTRSPAKMEDYLATWWKDLTSHAGDQPVQTLLSYLVVADGPIARSELVDIAAGDSLSSFTFDRALDRIGRFVAGDPETGLSLAHWRLQLFAESTLSAQEERRLRAALFDWCARWRDHHYGYALVHWPRQLLLHATAPADLAAVADTLCDEEFQRARVEEAGDAAGLLADIDRLLHALPRHPLNAATLVRVAYEIERARDRWLHPEAVVELARRGDLAEAIRRLGLLGPQPVGRWTGAAQLILALAAVEANPENVRDLLDQMDQQALGDPLLTVLHGRVLARIGAGKEPDLTMWFPPYRLPEFADRGQAVQALERAGGAPLHERGISGMPAAADDEDSLYMAETDGPGVVAYARDNPAEGSVLLATYIDLHLTNPYPLYRNRSLLSILAAVACLPDVEQALQHAVRTATGAYARDTVRFAEFARLALLARKARFSPRGLADLVGLRDAAIRAAQNLQQTREGADRWGHHARRLASHAEVAHLVLGDGQTGRELLSEAMAVPFGYAGYRGPACLAIAQAWNVAFPADIHGRARALDDALTAAHNIQEPSFCALMTARVNTMTSWWKDPVNDLGEVVAAFTKDPASARFAPRLALGETFDRRSRHDHLPVDHITALATPEAVADELGLPRLAVTTLTALAVPGTVALPDPGFTPMVAAYLSARVAAGPPDERTVGLTAALVPFAAADPAQLDQVLGRLLCVVPELGDDEARAVEAVVARRTTVEPSGEWAD